MIVVTGAAGFIGSALVSRLNAEGFRYIIAVDNFKNNTKNRNIEGKHVREFVDRDRFPAWLDAHYEHVEFLFHIGARTDTAETDTAIFDRLHLNYTKGLWRACCRYQIPMVYASSAATYGLGEQGYKDEESLIPQLKPLNPYGESKNDFDKWAIAQAEQPFYWAGLKFFNVYGPNEYHKGRMASVIFHAYHQISQTKAMKLFRSHHPDFQDGQQQRDFIYVKDLLEVLIFLLHHRKDSGIYNLGMGTARTFYDLAANVFRALELPEAISFIDTPADIRDKYQYFTEADMGKLRSIGYAQPFRSLEEGIADYVSTYLKPEYRFY